MLDTRCLLRSLGLSAPLVLLTPAVLLLDSCVVAAVIVLLLLAAAAGAVGCCGAGVLIVVSPAFAAALGVVLSDRNSPENTLPICRSSRSRC